MDTKVLTLGTCTHSSPLKLSKVYGDNIYNYVEDEHRILYDNTLASFRQYRSQDGDPPSFECAGPREKIYFNPKKTHAAIVTCGGLCPGLNDVIRAIVMELYYSYGVSKITGIRYGYNGLIAENGFKVKPLSVDIVVDIHKTGGTILGSSRGGGERVDEIVDTLESSKINILFCIGGDGTLRGALDICREVTKRKLKISIIGIPKTIDNDINYVEQTFGFETAFSKGMDAIDAAHVEARGAMNGIGLVKLMGRNSGYVAAMASLATNDVNYVLIPEVPFTLGSKNGLFPHLHKRLKTRGHAVIVVAEGAGQGFFEADRQKDASGNVKLRNIGVFLKDGIKKYFKDKNFPISLKYIDPSYIIRAAPANPNDSIFCADLGRNAVHAAMTGKTCVTIGVWNHVFTHVPIELVTSEQKQIDPESALWWHVIESTGQPMNMV
ncbi:ATP-dependent 6-phosphofructokinase [Spirochaetota bacterium]